MHKSNNRSTYLPSDNGGLIETMQSEIKALYGVKVGDDDIVHIALLNALIQLRERSNPVIESNISLIASIQDKENQEKYNSVKRFKEVK